MISPVKILNSKIGNIIQKNILITKKEYIPLQNDLFIAEFPKSGVTWLSTILANIEVLSLQEGSTTFHEANNISFYNLECFVSDIHLGLPSTHISTILGGKIIKTHDKTTLNYHRAIYLYRHPTQVMRSYYRMCKGHKIISEETSFREFIEDDNKGIKAWKRHIHGWLFNSSPSQRLFFLSYENLMRNTFQCVKEIYDCFGLTKVPDSFISQAIERSEISRMQNSEEKLKEKDLRFQVRYDINYRFVKGRKEVTDPENDKFIIDLCKHELEILGYLD